MIKQLRSPVLILIMLLTAAYCSFVDRFGFNYQLEQDQHYELLLLAALFLLISIPVLLQQSARIIICSLLLAACTLDSANEYLNTVTPLLVISILVSGAPTKWLLPAFFYGNLGFLLIQTGICLHQHAQGDPMTGSFRNTGVLANYLAVVTPSLFLIKLAGKKILILAGLILAGSVLFIVIENQARTALIALTLTAAVLIFHYTPNRFKLVYFLTVALGFAGIVAYSSSIKQTSAAGRVLLNKIAIRHIGDHFWWGTGLGRFTWYYPQWQSDYFLQNPSDPLRMTAGESHLIFNEYLQLFETVGLAGMIPFLGLLGWFFITRSTRRGTELFAIKLTVLPILICGTTFYAFHTNTILFIFFSCIALAISLDERKAYNTRWRKTIPAIHITGLIAGLAALLICIPGIWQRRSAVNEWHQAKEIDRAYSVQKTDYERRYSILRQDGKFLNDYGIFLMQDTAERRRSLQLLITANQKFISWETMMALGNAYAEMQDTANAIRCFNFLKTYIPYSFEPKFNLMKLYLASGDYSHARRMADSILSTPPKIPSDKVTYIKQETARLLNIPE